MLGSLGPALSRFPRPNLSPESYRQIHQTRVLYSRRLVHWHVFRITKNAKAPCHFDSEYLQLYDRTVMREFRKMSCDSTFGFRRICDQKEILLD